MMFNFKEMQSTSATIFQAYASWAASMMMIRSMANELIPSRFKSFFESLIGYLFSSISTDITIVVDDQCGMSRNEIYDAAEIYLSKKISPNTERFKVSKTPKQKSINVCMEKNQIITDEYGGVKISWRYMIIESQNESSYIPEKRYFEVTFHKKHRDAVVNIYFPFVLEKAKEIKISESAVKLYTRDVPFHDDDYNASGSGIWGAINLDHPATFDTLAMDLDAKKAIIDDLDRFVRRRDYYRKVGKAWKRGYLLYGPPGTGKSTLVAAMANYLKFDVYDLELTSIYSNSELRRTLVSTTNRSIIVIEDIDCSMEMHDRQQLNVNDTSGYYNGNNKLTLSGLLNFIDGLWSSCGDEKIIIFTTNYKEKLDPALLRPGRMDLHIHMSYCTPEGFKVLALNYLGLGINEEHNRLPEIENLIENVEVTPAELAEELMRSEDVDVALDGVVNFLKRKRIQKRNEFKMEMTGLLEQEQEEEDTSLSEPYIGAGGAKAGLGAVGNPLDLRSLGAAAGMGAVRNPLDLRMLGGRGAVGSPLDLRTLRAAAAMGNVRNLRRRQSLVNVRPSILRQFPRPMRGRGRTVTRTFRVK